VYASPNRPSHAILVWQAHMPRFLFKNLSVLGQYTYAIDLFSFLLLIDINFIKNQMI
jgi:hypothetical protein